MDVPAAIDDDVELPEFDAAPPAAVLPSVELAPVPVFDPVVLAALEVAEGGGAFTPPPDSGSCP
jgi:hypothetical protein